MKQAIQLSIVVPIFNSEKGIPTLFEELHKSLGHLSVEYIFVDDASMDNSWQQLKQLKINNQNVKIIRLGKNFGQHGATLCGFNNSEGQWVLTLDDDLEVKPEEAAKLLSNASEDFDLIYGEYEQQENWGRKILKSLYRMVSKLEGPNKGRGSSFRLIRGDLARTIAARHHHFVFIDEFLLWYTDKVQFVPVNNNPSPLRKSRYQTSGLVLTTGKLMMYSTAIPLKLVTRFGFFLAAVNLLVGLWFFRIYLIDKIEVKGYTSLIVSILFSTGVILFCLGIIAQYLRNVLMNLNNAPTFYIREKEC
jgi:polyisoprenyl-phosphate glycosyltransferase